MANQFANATGSLFLQTLQQLNEYNCFFVTKHMYGKKKLATQTRRNQIGTYQQSVEENGASLLASGDLGQDSELVMHTPVSPSDFCTFPCISIARWRQMQLVCVCDTPANTVSMMNNVLVLSRELSLCKLLSSQKNSHFQQSQKLLFLQVAWLSARGCCII